VIEVDEGVDGPEPFTHRLASDDLPWAFEEHCQQLKRLFLQLELDAVAAKLSRLEIGLEGPESNSRRRRRALVHRRRAVYRRSPAASKQFSGDGKRRPVNELAVHPRSIARPPPVH
jgi:hypothetical protein